MARLPSSVPSPLVGRERELDVLRDHLRTAFASQGSLVLISGEAGIGKTALAEALCREASERGACVLIGRCYDLTETPPYGPWSEVFARYRPDDELPAPPPAFAERGMTGVAHHPAALARQTLGFLTALAGRRPVLVVLDDLHWADPASLDLLRAIARHLAALPLLLVATYRSDEVPHGPLATLLPLLAREARASRLDLRPLDATATRTLVDDRYALAENEAARLVAHLRERAEGNPLFIGELLRWLEETGAMQCTAGGWAVGDLTTAAVPALLGQVIGSRVARLGTESRRLLGIATVIGHDVPYDLWCRVADVPEDDLIVPVEEGSAARLIESTPDLRGVRFTHALVRQALYEGISPLRRRRYHRQAAEALAALPHPPADAVAFHFERAGDARAYAWFIRAGEHAARAYAWLTAADRFEAALQVMHGDDAHAGERGWLLFHLAWFRRWSAPTQGLAQLDEATRCAAVAGDPALAACARYSHGVLRCINGDLIGIGEMEAGVAARRALSPADQARLRDLPLADMTRDRTNGQGSLVQWLATVGRFDEARRIGERAAMELAAEPAEREPDSSDADLAFGLAQAYAGLGRVADATDAYARTRAIYHALGHEIMLLTTHFNTFRCLYPYLADDPASIHRILREAEELAERVADNIPEYQRRYPHFLHLLLSGQWTEARRSFPISGPLVSRQGVAKQLLCPIAYAQGDTAFAWEIIRSTFPDGAASAPAGSKGHRTAIELFRIAAALLLDAGKSDDARIWLEAHDRWVAWSGSPLGRADGALAWAAYHRAIGDGTGASACVERALAEARDPRQPLVLLGAHRLLGELTTDAGDLASAESHLNGALTLADACALPYERAGTLLARAAWHAARGDAQGAETALTEARAICTALNAQPTLARVEDLARRLATRHTAPPALPAGLSPREADVLRLIAAGKTNREIADILFISPATVNIHVTHILTKTNTANRAEATAFALRHGLA